MMLAGALDEPSALFEPPPDERWYEEFLVALRAGMFGKGRSTRVLLLNPDKPFSPWRLTTDDAERIIESRGWPAFVGHYAAHAWIEIDRAHGWLASWLTYWYFQEWLSVPRVQNALMAHKPAPVGPNAGQAASATSAQTRPPTLTTGNDLVDAAASWLADTAAEMVRQGKRLKKEQALELARQKFGSGLSGRAFENRVWPSAAPIEWKRRGRLRKHLSEE